jgi:hypothetical protein
MGKWLMVYYYRPLALINDEYCFGGFEEKNRPFFIFSYHNNNIE